jgi:hypothetical protein
MRLLYLFAVIYAALILTGCDRSMQNPPAVVIQTQTTTIIPPCARHHRNLQQVSLITKPSIDRPYKVVGKATVSKYNVAGFKRQEATIRDIMREFAASMGGDALINIQTDDKTISATIIAYQEKNLLTPA